MNGENIRDDDPTAAFGAFTDTAAARRKASGLRDPWRGPGGRRPEWVGKDDLLQHDGSVFAIHTGDMSGLDRWNKLRVSVRRQLRPYQPGECWVCGVAAVGRFCSEHCRLVVSDLLLRFRPLVFARDGGRCRSCSTPFLLSMNGWEIDHIVPLADGGEHEWSNLQLLCRPCHIAKGSEAMRAKSPLRHVVSALKRKVALLQRELSAAMATKP